MGVSTTMRTDDKRPILPDGPVEGVFIRRDHATAYASVLADVLKYASHAMTHGQTAILHSLEALLKDERLG